MSDTVTAPAPTLSDPDDICRDFDDDCEFVVCKLTCWLHAPEEGICPYLLGGSA